VDFAAHLGEVTQDGRDAAQRLEVGGAPLRMRVLDGPRLLDRGQLLLTCAVEDYLAAVQEGGEPLARLAPGGRGGAWLGGRGAKDLQKA